MTTLASRLFVLIALTAAAPTAMAQDVKTYPGTICSPMDGRQWANTEFVSGQLRNLSGSALYVSCSLPTDEQGGAPVGGLSVEVRSSNAGTFECTAYSGDASGVSRAYTRSVVATGWGQWLTMQWSADEIQRDPLAPVGVNCKMLSSSDIVQIRMQEPTTSGSPDTKTVTGAQCRPMDGRQRDRLRMSALAITNQSDLDTYISCSLPTDGESAYTGGSLALNFIAGSAPGTVNCSAYSGDVTGGATSVAASGYAYAFGKKTLEWNSNIAGGPSKPIGFNCKLPPHFKLARIYWAEPVATETP